MNGIARKQVVFFVLLLCLLYGCRVAPTPTASPTVLSTPTPTATIAVLPKAMPTSTFVFQEYVNITPEFIPSATPPALDYTTQDALGELPLTPGATWVYSSTNYDTLEGGGQVTATFRVTDTVVAVEPRDTSIAAHIAREVFLVRSTVDLAQLPHGEMYFADMQNPQAKWLIVQGNRVYQQWQLDWTDAESGQLVYLFPLREGNRWYPNREQRALFSPYRESVVPGVRIIPWHGTYSVPAGMFQDCYEIREIYNPGDMIEWFCRGVGIVAEQFDHSGTPFGFRRELIRFTR